MRIDIPRDDLYAALKTVVPATKGVGGNIPILETVHIRQDGTSVHFTCNNLETEISARVEVATPGSADFTAPARKLLSLTAALPPEPLVLEVKKGPVRLTSSVGRYTLASLPASEFPGLKPSGPEGSPLNFKASGGGLRDAIAKCRSCVAVNDVRFYLNGMLFDTRGNTLTLVATDGHRLSSTVLDIDRSSGEDMQGILPVRALDMLSSMLPDDDTDVSVAFFKGRSATFGIEGVHMTTLLVDGTYPDWKRVVPDVRKDHVVEVDSAAMISALKRSMALQPGVTNAMSLEVDPAGTLTLTLSNAEQEMAVERMSCTPAAGYAGGARVGINARYLQSVTEVMPVGPATLQIRSEDDAVRIGHLEDPRSVHVVMPMRI